METGRRIHLLAPTNMNVRGRGDGGRGRLARFSARVRLGARGAVRAVARAGQRSAVRLRMRRYGALRALRGESGQGTTEYAILVGVLVVIAILAITLFKPKIQELWDAIANGINGL